VGSAVHDAVKQLQEKLKEIVIQSPGTAFSGKDPSSLSFTNGILKDANSGSTIYVPSILEQAKLPELKVSIESQGSSEMEKYSGKSFCAHFVEVLVHPTTGMVKTSRVVTAIDAGKIMNLKTATSQVYGSVAWGLGIALMEEGIIDHRYGRYVNNNLADYHLPVHADIPPIDVIFIDKPDLFLDPMGAKGLGEIGLIGLTAAIANAVYHATGKRIRNLPITPDKLL
jgi:xanthine dehydrogenase YagR molybdenum-binding subunit